MNASPPPPRETELPHTKLVSVHLSWHQSFLGRGWCPDYTYSTHTLTRVWRCIAYTIHGYEHQRSSKLKNRDPISEFTHSNYPAFLCIEETTGAVGVQADTTMRGSSPQLLCSLSVGQICTWTWEEVFGQHTVMLFNLKTQPFLDGVLQVPVPQALYSFRHYITITTTSTLTQL